MIDSLSYFNNRNTGYKVFYQSGIPVGRPQTIVVDLGAVLRPHEHVIRIVTNMRIYWDRIVVGAATASDGLPRMRLSMTAAK